MGSTIAAWVHFLSLFFEADHQLVPIHKWPIFPLSALHENLILGISIICLRLKFSCALISTKSAYFWMDTKWV